MTSFINSRPLHHAEVLSPAGGQAPRAAGVRAETALPAAGLGESHALCRLLFDSNPHPMWMYDLESLAFLAVNDAAVRHYGYSREEFLAMTIKDIRPPLDLPALLDNVNRVRADEPVSAVEHAGVWRHRKKDRTHIEVEITSHAVPFEGRRAEVVLASDVTERRRIAEALRASEERFRQLAENIHEVFWMTDVAKNQMLYISPGYEAIWGRSCDSLYQSPRDWVEAVHAEDRDRVLAAALTKQASGDYDEEYRIIRPDGSARWIHDRAFPIKDRHGRVYRMTGIAEDITERKRAEAECERRAGEWHTLLESAVEGIYGLDAQGRCTFVNQSAARMLGYTPDEMIGQEIHALIHHTRADGTPFPIEDCPIYHAFYARRSCRVDDEVLWRKDGTKFPVEYACAPILRHGEFQGAVVTFSDSTEHNRLEAQLRQAQKMEAVGRLAGGVAHDFNNLLTVMHGRADLVLNQLPPGSEHGEDLREVLHAVKRAASLTRQLLTFSRQQPMQVRPLDLNAVVNDVSKMLRRIVGEDVAMRVRGADALPAVRADVGMMEQVLMNLAINARDAMPKGGQLTLETTVEQIDADYIRLHAEAAPGPHVCLSVSDTGCGIPAAVLPRIFEPFFTTKAVGKGTGLGLATVYGIVKQHNGWINVYSEMNQGTVFRVYLPAVPAAAGVAAPAAPPAGPVRGGTETILVVEDDVAVREMVRLFLKGRGYRVLEAGSGVAALEVWREQANRIDLVLTDMVMPDGLSGWELAEVLWAHKPELKIIYTSGYSAESVGHEFTAHAQFHFLQKPYEPRKLLAMVRQCLDGQSGSQAGEGPSF